MSTTPKPHPSVQRLNKAFIQVPASPLTLSSYRTFGTPAHVAASSKLKENTPLRPLQLGMNQQPSGSTLLKRKLSDRDSSSLIFDGVLVPFKKHKPSSTMNEITSSAKEIHPESLLDPACRSLSNGFLYCHQCNKKRDVSDVIRCTVVEKYYTIKDKNIKERTCSNKYCKFCLKNRYEEDFEVFKASTNGKNAGFQCPRCRDICNCPRCRKSKGLEPTGFIPKPKPDPALKVKASKPVANEANAKESKPRDLPTLKWTPVPIHLTQVEAEDRIFIREFVLRFGDHLAPVMAKSNIEELELIGGRPGKLDDDDEVTGWVSDPCVKALFVGLLGVLAQDHESNLAKAIKELRAAGFNLNKLWNILFALRADTIKISASGSPDTSSKSGHSDKPLTFPDPSPPPNSAVATARSLRSLRQSESMVNVVSSTQMIPVLVSLMHQVLETAIVREELDQGAKNARDMIRDAKEATRIESERWEKERNAMEVAPKDKALKTENRTKRMLHKDQIANIDNSMKIISTVFTPRFTPLGTDLDDRVYYALSPGVAERQAAFEYIELASSEKPSKPKRKGRLLSPDDRLEMREWSWFVAVWGKKTPSLPAAGTVQKMEVDGTTDESENESDDEAVEKWWGFWEPGEISKVAEWISIKAGLDDDEESTTSDSRASSSSIPKDKVDSSTNPRTAPLRRLVTELKDYAALLQWRTREDKLTLLPRIPSVSLAKSQEETASNAKETPSLGSIRIH
ncbi:hypothetical protein M413DRAFT_442058 [Hebeloma cylindrosporum]|uniref:Zinc-finger domain-containing protein n=1 Tax=Hebeloma cylindrosporum TaxID=76867 RepID=A0A0C2YWL1_HEBCY|nr:hypothetical protein M413DRAFT_442058 [Hebeloma cylindrosporum h7]